jgi:hypothetical protein
MQFAPNPVLGGLQWQVLKVHGQALVERKSQTGCLKKLCGILTRLIDKLD